MPSKDFTSNQIRVTKLIASGGLSGGGAQSGNNIGIAVYSASNASDAAGGIADASMLDQAGKDVFMFISGSTTPNGRGTTGGAITLLGGDMHVSGNISTDGSFSFVGTAERIPFFESGTGVFTQDDHLRISELSQDLSNKDGGVKRTVTIGDSGTENARMLLVSEPMESNLLDKSEARQYATMLQTFDTAATGSIGLGFSRNLGQSVGAGIVFKSKGANSQGMLEFYSKANTTLGGNPVLRLRSTDYGTVEALGSLIDQADSVRVIAAGNDNGIFTVGYSDGNSEKLVFDRQAIQSKTIGGNPKPLILQPLGAANNGKGHLYIGTTDDGIDGTTYTKHAYSVHIHTSSTSNNITNTCYAVKVRHDTDVDNIDAASYGGIQIQVGRDNPSTTGQCQWMSFLNGSGGFEGSIQYNHSSGGAVMNTSDERIKYDIADTKINALPILNNVILKEFRKNTNNLIDPGTSIPLIPIGFTAQNVEPLIPYAVAECQYDPERGHYIKTLDQGSFIPYLVKAVQELSAENDALKARIEALES